MKKKLSKNITKIIAKNNVLVLKNSIAITFMFTANLVFITLFRGKGQWGELLLQIVILLTLFLAGSVVMEYMVKMRRLNTYFNNQNNVNYGLFAGINSILGLAIPFMYINFLLLQAVRSMSRIPVYDNVFSELKQLLINTYISSNVYNQLSIIVLAIWIMAIGVIIYAPILSKNTAK